MRTILSIRIDFILRLYMYKQLQSDKSQTTTKQNMQSAFHISLPTYMYHMYSINLLDRMLNEIKFSIHLVNMKHGMHESSLQPCYAQEMLDSVKEIHYRADRTLVYTYNVDPNVHCTMSCFFISGTLNRGMTARGGGGAPPPAISFV